MSRPINPASERTIKPWTYALVSRRTYYKAKHTLLHAGWPLDKPIDARAMIDFAPILRAATREGYTLSHALTIYLDNGLDLSQPPRHYTPHQHVQANDGVKRGNIKKKGHNLDHSLGDDIITVEGGRVVDYGAPLRECTSLLSSSSDKTRG